MQCTELAHKLVDRCCQMFNTQNKHPGSTSLPGSGCQFSRADTDSLEEKAGSDRVSCKQTHEEYMCTQIDYILSTGTHQTHQENPPCNILRNVVKFLYILLIFCIYSACCEMWVYCLVPPQYVVYISHYSAIYCHIAAYCWYILMLAQAKNPPYTLNIYNGIEAYLILLLLI